MWRPEPYFGTLNLGLVAGRHYFICRVCLCSKWARKTDSTRERRLNSAFLLNSGARIQDSGAPILQWPTKPSAHGPPAQCLARLANVRPHDPVKGRATWHPLIEPARRATRRTHCTWAAPAHLRGHMARAGCAGAAPRGTCGATGTRRTPRTWAVRAGWAGAAPHGMRRAAVGTTPPLTCVDQTCGTIQRIRAHPGCTPRGKRIRARTVTPWGRNCDPGSPTDPPSVRRPPHRRSVYPASKIYS